MQPVGAHTSAAEQLPSAVHAAAVAQMRADLRLSSIYVCAPDVLVLLSDNFDYQTVARDLVPGVLSEQELGSTMHIYELARVRAALLALACAAAPPHCAPTRMTCGLERSAGVPGARLHRACVPGHCGGCDEPVGVPSGA